MKDKHTVPEWLKESIKKDNLNEQLADIVMRYNPNPDVAMGEYNMDDTIGFMQAFLMGLADKARKYYEKKMLHDILKAIKEMDYKKPSLSSYNLSKLKQIEGIIDESK